MCDTGNVHVYMWNFNLCVRVSDWDVPSIKVTSLLLKWHIFQQQHSAEIAHL